MFPFQRQTRPSSLPLPVGVRKKDANTATTLNSELKQYAGTLVDGVIKTVSEESRDDSSATQSEGENTVTEDDVEKTDEDK